MGKRLDKTADTDPRDPGRKVHQYQSDSKEEDDVEVSSEDSFPASDPPSNTPISHTGKPKPGQSGRSKQP